MDVIVPGLGMSQVILPEKQHLFLKEKGRIKSSNWDVARGEIPVFLPVRAPLPFENESFDACYSHMLYCMALNTAQLEFLSREILRVLKPGGLNIYTARHTGDTQYGTGIPRGQDMFEIAGGFIVHFLSKEKVEQLAKGYKSCETEEFEEGELSRKLYMVTMKK